MLKTTDQIKTGATWPPESEDTRLERYEKNRKVLKGDHLNTYFKTLEEIKKVRPIRHGDEGAIFFILNLPKRLVKHWRDMLFYEQPILVAANAKNKKESEDISVIAEQTNLFNEAAPEAEIDRVAFGDGVLRVGISNEIPVIEAIPPEQWFPVSSTHMRREDAHVIAWPFSRMETSFGTVGPLIERWYYRFEIHTAGQIQYKIFRYTKDTKKLGAQVNLSEFEPDLVERVDAEGIETTDLDDMLVIPVHGFRTSMDYHGEDDFTDLESLIAGLESRLSHVDNVLDKHSEPKMSGPPATKVFNATKGTYEVDIEGHYFEVDEGQPDVKYIVWDAQMEAAWKEIEVFLDLFYFISETSPAAFAQLKQGLAESGSALKRLMMADLHRVARDRNALGAAIVKAVDLIGQLQGRQLFAKIHWFDGLPNDQLEEAQAEEILVRSGLTDQLSAIMRVHNLVYEEDALEIYNRIQEEKAANAAFSPGSSLGLFGRTDNQQ